MPPHGQPGCSSGHLLDFDAPPGGGGNTVVVEHTGDNGKKLYSFYMHLRNGATNEISPVRIDMMMNW